MPGLRKLLRDFTASWGRSLTLILVLALGTTVFGATFGAYGELTREIRRAYVDTAPASATLELSSVSVELLEQVRQRQDVQAATRRRTLHARFRASPEQPWGNALVFIADDFTQMPLAKLEHQRGAVRPLGDTVLIERSAVPILGGDVGSSLELSLPGGAARRVTVSGVVHEAALAPANTHACIYLYASPALVQSLGDTAEFDELRIVVSQGADDVVAIERTAQAVAAWIDASGLGNVHEIRVPPPGQHPHQTQMTTVLALLLVFAVLVFVMSALLAAALLTTLLARQVREIGVLKTLGATSPALTRWYVLAMGVFALLAAALAWLPARCGAKAWSIAVAKMLNFDLRNEAIPTWISVVTLVSVLSIPVVVTLPNILRATRAPVLSTLQDFGIGQSRYGERQGIGDRLIQRVSLSNRLFSYALRNVSRLRRKLGLSLALFAVSGGIAIAAVSVADAWQAWSVRLRSEQDFDVEVTLANSAHLEETRDGVSQRPMVAAVEEWLAVPTAWARTGGFPLRRTYPDDAHGAFMLVAPPPTTAMLHVTVTEGRWLNPAEANELVLNQMVSGQSEIPVGANVTLAVEGTNHTFTVVGKVEQVGVGSTAYVNAATLRGFGDSLELGRRLRIKAKPEIAVDALLSDLERTLSQNGANVSEIMPLGVYENAMVAHFEILVRALMALAGLTALVGTLGLSSTIAVSVLERTRELGIIRAIGGSAPQARNLVVTEGLIVGGISVVLSILLGLGLAWGLGTVIGRMSFALPLPLTPSYSAMSFWTLAVMLLTGVASAVPARRVARLTVREAVNHV